MVFLCAEKKIDPYLQVFDFVLLNIYFIVYITKKELLIRVTQCEYSIFPMSSQHKQKDDVDYSSNGLTLKID